MSSEIYTGHIGCNRWTIYNQDCKEALNHITSNSIDCIITSPPYLDARAYGEIGECEGNKASYFYAERGTPLQDEVGNGQTYEAFMSSMKIVLEQCYRILKDDKFFFININKRRRDCQTIDVSHDMIPIAKSVGFNHRDTLIWIKQNTRPVFASAKPYYLDDGWEYIIVLAKGRAKLYRDTYYHNNQEYMCNQCRSLNIIEKNTTPNYIPTNIGYTEDRLTSPHPAKFPLAIPRFALSISTQENDTVLDPFSGIGTTLIAGLERKLNVVGIELNKDFCKASAEEINNRLLNLSK